MIAVVAGKAVRETKAPDSSLIISLLLRSGSDLQMIPGALGSGRGHLMARPCGRYAWSDMIFLSLGQVAEANDPERKAGNKVGPLPCVRSRDS